MAFWRCETTSQTFPVFDWTKARAEAAVLVAEDDLSDVEIAQRAGISRRQLTTWKQHPAFASRVQAHVSEIGRRLLRYGITKRVRRVAALNDRWERMQAVIEARSHEYADEVSGGETGLLVRTIKVLGGGPHAMKVEEYAVDTGLLKELRETEKQAAQEVGQWTERHEYLVRQEAERVAAAIGMTVDEVLAEAERLVAGKS